ncbi:hypothetical protein HK405_014348, partial [Cladochytrium tenue]
MSQYSPKQLVDKLRTLTDTQESITLVSHSTTHRKLSFLHLCNDVLQTSRRRGEEFAREFARALPSVLPRLHALAPADARAKIARLLAIWEDRQVYPPGFVSALRGAVAGNPTAIAAAASAYSNFAAEPAAASPPPPQQQQQQRQQSPPVPPTRRTSSASLSGDHADQQQQQQQRPEAVRALLARIDGVRSSRAQRLHAEQAAKRFPTPIPPDDEHAVVAALTALRNALAIEIEERKRLLRDFRSAVDSEERHQATASALLA